MISSDLVWPPIFSVIEERVRGGDEIILLLVPFVKLEALKRLHSAHSATVKFKVICRWRPLDLITGVSDIEVFSYLKNCGSQLYINPDIHLKLYIFASNAAFTTSGNLTLHGLGYAENPNIEVGNMVLLTSSDWNRIYEVIDASRQVDDTLYQHYKQFLEQHPRPAPITPLPNLLTPARLYTISSLPATESPEALAEFYFDQNSKRFSSEVVRRGMHDLHKFQIPPDLAKTEFDDRLSTAFKSVPFVTEFVEYLKQHGTLRFGAVNNWIHEKCEDVPLPYKWEIKENTRILYNWLSHFYREIDWNIPGEHSQVIYWLGSDHEEIPANAILKRYQAMFSDLSHRERGEEWNDISHGAAPHQPLLLLAVIALYDNHPERSNMIMLDAELERIFRSSFDEVVRSPHETSIVMPFVVLGKEPFWHLKQQGGVAEIGGQIKTRPVFDRVYSGAYLDEELHELMQLSPMRVALRETVLAQ